MKEHNYKFRIKKELHEIILESFALSTLFERRRYRDALRMIHVIQMLANTQTGSQWDFAEISSKYFRKMLSGEYLRVLNRLKEIGVIEVFTSQEGRESYIVKDSTDPNTGKKHIKGVCKKYRISPKFQLSINYSNNKLKYKQNNNRNSIKGGICCQLFENPDFTEVKYAYKPKKQTPENQKFQEDFQRMYDLLEIEYQKLYKKAEQIIDNLKKEDYQVTNFDNDKDIERFHVITTGSRIPMTLKKAKDFADYRYESIFKVKNQYIIAGKQQFIERMRNNMYESFVISIDKLRNKELYAARNNVNKRLDTNFTSLRTELFEVIMEDNNLSQKDLHNSQFCILANHLKNKKNFRQQDFEVFYDWATEGVLYDEIAKILQLPRKEVKLLMFQILFNKSGAHIKHKELLQTLFPSVVGYIDRFKKKRGYKAFSVFLQNQESEIFVDGLKPLLEKQMDLVFLKHDAVIVRDENKELTDYITEKYFKEIGFKGKMTWEG